MTREKILERLGELQRNFYYASQYCKHAEDYWALCRDHSNELEELMEEAHNPPSTLV